VKVNGYMAEFSRGIAASGQHAAAAHHSAANARSHEEADQVVALPARAVNPLTPGGGTNIIGNEYRHVQGISQDIADWHIAPVEIRGKPYGPADRVYLAGDTYAHSHRFRDRIFPQFQDGVNNLRLDGNRTFAHPGGEAALFQNLSRGIYHRYRDFCPTQVNAYAPAIVQSRLM
jgi:hypothetical protein